MSEIPLYLPLEGGHGASPIVITRHHKSQVAGDRLWTAVVGYGLQVTHRRSQAMGHRLGALLIVSP